MRSSLGAEMATDDASRRLAFDVFMEHNINYIRFIDDCVNELANELVIKSHYKNWIFRSRIFNSVKQKCFVRA